ncbi:MAG: dihydroorotase family protein [Thermofilum sp.]
MRRVDLLLVGRAYVDGSLEEVAVAVDGGRVVAVTRPPLAPLAEKKLELGASAILLPGMVDIHVHMREPGLEYKEDWRTGSMAAAKGGVTCVFDMPNNSPPANTCERLREKFSRASAKSLVDFGFYAGFSPNLEGLAGCPELFLGLKLYPEDLFHEKSPDAFALAAKLGKPVVVHAEDPSRFKPSDIHSEARPPEAELSAARHAILLAARTGAWLHLTHVSTGAVLREALAARVSLSVTTDVTPHHMLLNESLYRGRAAGLAKVNPPLRGEEDRRDVYEAARKLAVDAVATDHAPHSLDEKVSPSPPPGFPGLEIALHLLLREILEGRFPLRALDLYSRRPSGLFGVRKGVIAPGFDADFVVVEKSEWVVKGSDFASKAKYTPFEGIVLRTKTAMTFVRGQLVYRNGEFHEGAWGSLVRPGLGRGWQLD